MVKSPDHQVWPKPSIWQGTAKGGKDKADRKRGGKKTSRNGQARSSSSPRGAVKNTEKWRKLAVKSSGVP